MRADRGDREQDDVAPETDGRESAAWHLFFRIGYAIVGLADPLIRAVVSRFPAVLPRTIDLTVPGRRSGRRRSTLLTLLSVGGQWYVGHPNGSAGWTRNLAAAGRGEIRRPDGSVLTVDALELGAGPERQRVIRATSRQQPFPADVAYRLARRHILRVGVYFRLVERP